jgi:hypothetical protein
MNDGVQGLERLLEHELSYYRCLVVLARTKHFLLRAGRQPDAVRLADIESQLLAHLELLEVTRRDLVRRNLPNALPTDALQTMEQTKAALIRRLRPIARANRTFDVHRIGATRAARLSRGGWGDAFQAHTESPHDAA